MTISLNPILFQWLREFEVVDDISEDLIPFQRWIRFAQIELFSYINCGYWNGEFEQQEWGDIGKDNARKLAVELYNLVIPNDVDYIKLEMEN